MKKLTAKIVDGDLNILVDIDKNALSIEYGSLDRGDLSEFANYGIYENTGKIVFFDNDGSFKNLKDLINKTPSIMQDLKVQIYRSSVVYSELTATFLIDDFVYDEDTSEVSLSLKDNLTLLQQIYTSKHYWFYETSCLDILIDIKNSSFDSSFNFYVTDKARYALANTIIYCPLLEADNLWSVVTKICEITLCRVISRADGKPMFYHVNEHLGKSNIVLPASHIFNIDNKISKYKTSFIRAWLKYIPRKRITNSEIISPISADIYTLNKSYNNEGLITWIEWSFIGDTNSIVTISRTDTGNWGNDYEDYSAEVTVTARIKPVDNVYSVGELFVYGNYNLFDMTKVNANVGIELTPSYNRIGLNSQSATMDEEGYINIKFSWTAANKFAFDSSNHRWIHDVWTDIKFYLHGDYFVDEEEQIAQSSAGLSGINDLELPSNELFQIGANTSAINATVVKIVRGTRNAYSQGIECCEVECLMMNCYYEDGTLAYDASGISKTIEGFQKYDCVIPYVLKNGVEQPYRIDADGSPMVFKIIGIKYSFKGILRQKLYLQAARSFEIQL